ncbi:MAG: hypothetical protein GX115_04145 [Ruminiclostridium sp.]|nr:hypothetical protein [Ruminiclostridium sp.]
MGVERLTRVDFVTIQRHVFYPERSDVILNAAKDLLRSIAKILHFVQDDKLRLFTFIITDY